MDDLVTAACAKCDEALARGHQLDPFARIAVADDLAALALRLRGAAAKLRTDGVAELVAVHGHEATAVAVGMAVRSVRRHVPMGQDRRRTTAAGKRAHAVSLYREGMPLYKVAARAGVDHRVAKAAILAAGIELRETHVRKSV